MANNVVLMSLSAVGLGDPNATDTSALGLAVSVALMATFTVLVTRRADTLGITRTRAAEVTGRSPAEATDVREAVPVP